METQLERLERVDHREIWPDEARDFTPWLANNLDVLESTLGIKLELEATEKVVGPSFKSDIICKEIGTDDSMVLIENQLEQTDHKHLGQLLTYAAGLEAVTIVWIAVPIRDEHRAALDWLNKVTDREFPLLRTRNQGVAHWGFGSCPKVQHCLKTKRLVEASYSLDQRDAENAGSLLDRFQRRAQQNWRTCFR